MLLHGSEDASAGAGGSHFLGGTYSMAEVCCTGFLQRGLATLPSYRGIDLREVVVAAKLGRCVWV